MTHALQEPLSLSERKTLEDYLDAKAKARELEAPATLDLAALAADPNVSVEKLERLMAMQERLHTRQAEALFNAAMAEAQKAMRSVAADADNPQTRSKYASYAQIDRALRPIYTSNGFGLSFDTADSGAPDLVRVLCYVTHAAGFARTYHIDMPNDGKGAKGGDVMTKTHATGAAMSYAMRYLLKMVFNVAVGEDDRDGNDIVPKGNAPNGFEEWAVDMDGAAGDGVEALTKAWKASKPSYRGFIRAEAWEQLKKKAKAADAQRAKDGAQ